MLGEQLKKNRRRKKVRARLDDIDENRRSTLVVHYSCESFYDKPDGYSPRVTSIAVRNFESGQTQSFSIHKVAELQGIEIEKISSEYDQLELKMLDAFYSYMRTVPSHQIVHWNMRDSNYGFQAIEQRHRALGGDPLVVDDTYKLDLARTLVTLFGKSYAPHGKTGRLHSIMDLNSVTAKDALTGGEEANAFDNAEFVKLHQSTLRKVDVIANLLELTIDKDLKVASGWFEQTEYHPAVAIEYAREHWIWSLILMIAVPFGIVRSLGWL